MCVKQANNAANIMHPHSIYNLYGRQNPFSLVTRAVNNTTPKTFRLSVLGNAIPSFTYNFKFE